MDYLLLCARQEQGYFLWVSMVGNALPTLIPRDISSLILMILSKVSMAGMGYLGTHNFFMANVNISARNCKF